MSRLEAFAAQLFASMEGYVLRAVEPVAVRLARLEAAAPPKAERGADGLTAFEIAVRHGFAGDEATWVQSLRGDPGRDGDDGPKVEDLVEDLSAVIEREVKTAVEAIPAPKDGAPGKDVDLDLLKAFVAGQVKTVAESIPRPTDGKDGAPGERGQPGIDGKDGAPGERGEVGPQGPRGEKGDPGEAGQRGADGAAGLDGAPGVQGDQGPAGKDGTPGETGPRGENGADGEIGSPGTDGQRGERGESAYEIARSAGFEGSLLQWLKALNGRDGEPGRDGANGRDGVDGKDGAQGAPGRDGNDGRDAVDLDVLGGIDFQRSYPRGTWATNAGGLWRAAAETSGTRGWECVVNGVASLEFRLEGRTFKAVGRLSDGRETVLEERLPHVEDRGVFKEGETYWRGDGVTWAGSWWIAQVDEPKSKPGLSDEWRLAVRRGREGKEGRQGLAGPRGERGERGEHVR